MKISKLFHYLYAAIMFLPLLLLPVFMIYSHRHTIDSGSIEVPQTQVVDFNQKYKGNGNVQNVNGSTLEQVDNKIIVDVNTNAGNIYFSFSLPTLVDDHLYYFKSDGDSSHAYTYLYVNSVYTPIVENDLVAVVGGSEISSLVTTSADFIGQFTYKFNIFDITQMFGAGNEPTKPQFAQWYSGYYDFVDSRNQLLQVGTIIYDDTDIMSQATYQLYNAFEKYFNLRNVFNLNSLYIWFCMTFFNGACPVVFTIIFNLFIYWLFVSLLWLLFDFFMYIPLVIHNGIDKARIE